jgi:hypothetical protein
MNTFCGNNLVEEWVDRTRREVERASRRGLYYTVRGEAHRPETRNRVTKYRVCTMTEKEWEDYRGIWSYQCPEGPVDSLVF